MYHEYLYERDDNLYEYLQNRMEEILAGIYSRLADYVDVAYVEEFAELLVKYYEKKDPNAIDILEHVMDCPLDIHVLKGDIEGFRHELYMDIDCSPNDDDRGDMYYENIR